MGKHMQHLDSLRQGMIQASTPQTVQPTAGQSAVSRFTTQAAGGAANDLFGPSHDPNDPQGGFRGGVTNNYYGTGRNPQGQDSNGKTNGYV
jgi:hypothetical protein